MDNRLSIGDKVCFVDASRVPVTEGSAEGCLKVVGFDDGYAPGGEFWAIVRRCDDAEFVYAGGTQGSTPYVATWFDNLHRCDDQTMPVSDEVADALNELVDAIKSMGYDVDIEFL